MDRSRETYWEGVAFSQAGDSGGLDQTVAVKMVRSGQIQGAFWRERQRIDFKREDLNLTATKQFKR